MFTSPTGKLLRHPNFRRGVWQPALAATGLTGVHFHDLRHAGNHMVPPEHDRARAGEMPVDLGFRWAPRARFERATYCLGGSRSIH